MEVNRHQLFMVQYYHNMSPALHIPMEVLQPYLSTQPESYELRLARGGKHLTQISMIVFIMTSISWVPFFINMAVNNGLPPDQKAPNEISATLGFLVILTAFVNIFIYTLKMQPFRKAMVNLLKLKT